MDTIWTKSKWRLEDLDHKTVEYRIPIRAGIAHGVGEFWVNRNSNGMLAIDLVTDEQTWNGAARVQTRYHLPQIGVDRIERHPDSSIASFNLS